MNSSKPICMPPEICARSSTLSSVRLAAGFASNVQATEVEIQDFIVNEFDRRDLTAGHPPIVAINAHSADPHYAPNLDHNLHDEER